MKTIYKYTLEIEDEQIVEMPINSKILTVQMQHELPQLWALVTPELPKEKRKFRIFGTGHKVSNDASKEIFNYISTFQVENGELVFHVFEVLN